MEECMYFAECQNNTKCLRCSDYLLLKQPKKKNYNLSKKSAVISKKDKPWQKLEKHVVTKINEKSRRTRASGALSYEKGDVLDELFFIECKSRKGNNIKKGSDKSFSVSKKWIEKANKEAEDSNKPMLLTFQFAEDADDPNKIYGIMNINDLTDIMGHIKTLRSLNLELIEKLSKTLTKESE